MSELANYLLINIPLATITVLGLHFSLTPKKNSFITFLIVEILFVPVAMWKKLIPGMNPLVSTIALWAVMILCGLFLYSNAKKTKIFNIAMVIIIQYIVTMITGTVYVALGGDLNYLEPTVIVLILFVNAVAYFFFVWIRKKHILGIENNRYTLIGMCLITLIQVITFCLIDIICYSGEDYVDKQFLGMMVQSEEFYNFSGISITLLFVVTDVIILIIMNRASKSSEMKKELEFSEYKQSLYSDYYAEVEANSIQTRKIRHDIANIVSSIGIMLKDNNDESRKIADELYERLKADVEGIHNTVYCQDTLLNAILSVKKSKCDSLGIETEFEVAGFIGDIIDKADMCKAFSNLLDNAINSTETASEKIIKLNVTTDENSMIITVVNPIGEKAYDKKDDGNHGYGLKILSDIAKKYDGKFNAESENRMFVSQMIIPQSPK